jgi:hypothetical protein
MIMNNKGSVGSGRKSMPASYVRHQTSTRPICPQPRQTLGQHDSSPVYDNHTISPKFTASHAFIPGKHKRHLGDNHIISRMSRNFSLE